MPSENASSGKIVKPRVSFIVPCYKLAHLLPECVHSILSQTYPDFEILIMDDCSPDNTEEVARSFNDPRVRHIRNEPNLGHLANYNKGIGLTKGEYVWLISADDFLRKPYVLARYVQLMDDNPNVGYVFCPAMRFINGKEAGVMVSTTPLSRDAILSGHEFLTRFELDADRVPSPAVMLRRCCHDELSLYPLDLPYCGDWYLWCLFAMFHDVAYLAEPMVSRRFHDSNMTIFFRNEGIQTYFDNLLAVPTRIKQRAEKEGFADVADGCVNALASGFLRLVIPPKPGDPIDANISVRQFEQLLPQCAAHPAQQARIRGLVYAGLGDHYYAAGNNADALSSYRSALRSESGISKTWFKYLLLRSGSFGAFFRDTLSTLKSCIRRA